MGAGAKRRRHRVGRQRTIATTRHGHWRRGDENAGEDTNSARGSHCGGASSGVGIGTGADRGRWSHGDVGTTDVGVVVVGDGASCAGARGASTNGEGASGRGPGPSIGPPPTGGECCGRDSPTADPVVAAPGRYTTPPTASPPRVRRRPHASPALRTFVQLCRSSGPPRKRINCILIVPRPSLGFRE